MPQPKRLALNDLSVGQQVRLYDTNSNDYYQARIIATDLKHDNPIVLASLISNAYDEDIETADKYGYVNGHTYIVESPEYFECWINVYKSHNGSLTYSTNRSEADSLDYSKNVSSTDTFIKTFHVKEEI